MKASRRRWGLLAILLPWGLGSCAASDSAESARPDNYDRGSDSKSNGTGGSAAMAPGAGGSAGAPAEQKVEKTFEAPVATKGYIWSANPRTGRVARIDANTFQIDTVQSGDGPKYVAAVPDTDEALVINAAGGDAVVLTSSPSGLSVQRYAIHDGANAWSVSRDGHWAIAWSDVSRYAAELGTNQRVEDIDPRRGFQQISVIDLTGSADAGAARQASSLAVGYRPTEIVFSDSVPEAYAVTADGISVIGLDAASPKFLRNIRYGCQPVVAPPDDVDAGNPTEAGAPTEAGSPTEAGAPAEGGLEAAASDAGEQPDVEAADAWANHVDAQAEAATSDAGAEGAAANPCDTAGAAGSTGTPDVSITKNGHYAVVRREGSAVLDILDLTSGAHTPITLSGPITDASLSKDGTKAIAVVRDTSEVAVLDIPGVITEPTHYADWRLKGHTIGRGIITEKETFALLFTTAYAVNQLVVLPLGAQQAPRLVDLRAPVYAVFPTSDEANAIVLHPPSADAKAPGAFSVVPLASDRPALIVDTVAQPKQVAPGNGQTLVSTTDGKDRHEAYVVRMENLKFDDYVLATAPMAVGIVGTMGYVAQEHSEGRVTFIDLSKPAGAAHTITGFELGASIVQWPARDGGSR